MVRLGAIFTQILFAKRVLPLVIAESETRASPQNLHVAWLFTGCFSFGRFVFPRSWLVISPPTVVKARTVLFSISASRKGLLSLGSSCLDPTSLPNSVFATSTLFSRNYFRSTKEGSKSVAKRFPVSSAHFARCPLSWCAFETSVQKNSFGKSARLQVIERFPPHPKISVVAP